jgi:hypothetical protein
MITRFGLYSGEISVTYFTDLIGDNNAASDEDFDLDLRLELLSTGNSTSRITAIFPTNTCATCLHCPCISQNCGTITCAQTCYCVPTRISCHPQTPVAPHPGGERLQPILASCICRPEHWRSESPKCCATGCEGAAGVPFEAAQSLHLTA